MASSTSPAVGRALDVLLHLAGRAGPVPGAALVRELGVPRSSAYHLLAVLVERGFVVHHPEQQAYGLGPVTFEVGSAYLRQAPLEHLGRPLARRLAARTGAVAHLGILHGADTLYLVRERPVRDPPLSVVTDVGVRLPASLTASGRAILAHLGREQVRAQFPSPVLVRRTGHGPATVTELHRLLAREHARGWAHEDGLVTAGTESVAACAFDHHGMPVAAFSLTRRADRARLSTAELATAARSAARTLTERLAGAAPAGWFPPAG